MKRQLSLILFAILAICFAAYAGEKRRQVRVGVYQNRPKVFLDEAGTPRGFFPEIIEAIAEIEEWRIQYVPGSWLECLNNLENGDIDLLVAIGYSPERDRKFDFNSVTVLPNWAYVYRAHGLNISDLLDLKGKRVAVMKGDIYAEAFRNRAEKFHIECEYLEVEDFGQVFEKISQREVDAGVISRLYAQHYKMGPQVARTSIIVGPSQLHFAVCKGKNADLLSSIDKHLTQWKDDEESIYYSILGRWVQEDDFGGMPSAVIYVLLIVFAMLVLAVLGNAFLRSQLKTQTEDLRRKTDELRKTNRALRALSQCNRVVVQAESEEELFRKVCQLLVDDVGYKMAWVGIAEDDEQKRVRPVACAGDEEGYLDSIEVGWGDNELGCGPTGTAIRTGEPNIYHDNATDDSCEPWKPEATARGFRSSIALPLTVEETVLGALNLYSKNAAAFDEDEVSLLEELADDVAYAVSNIRTRDSRKRTERQLQESEQKYRSLFESVNDAIFVIRGEEFIDCNPATEQMFGLARHEIIGKHPFDISPPEQPDGRDSVEKGKKKFELAYQGMAQSFEWVHSRSDGTDFYADVSLNRFQVGEEWLLLAVVRDITERKLAEHAVRESEERFSLFMDYLPAAVFIKDAKGRNIYLNRYMQDVIGADDSWIGKRSDELFPDDVARPMMADDQKALEDGYLVVEESVPDKEGIEHVYESHKFPIPREGRPPLLGGISLDITDRREAQERLRHLNAVLQAIRNVNQVIVREDQRDELIQKACRSLTRRNDYEFAWIGLLDNSNELILQAQAGLEPDAVQLKELPGCAEQAIRKTGPRVVARDEEVCENCPLASTCQHDGVLACRFESEGRIYGVLISCVSLRYAENPEEKELFQEMVDDLAFGLRKLELAQQRDRAEDALRQSEKKYRLVAETMQDIICVHDLDGGIQYLNRAGLEFVGLSEDEVCSMNVTDFLPESELTSMKMRRDARLSGDVRRRVYKTKLQDNTGEEVPVEVSSSPIMEQGEATGIMLVARDLRGRD
ncbi:MAG: PAS domain S-box protein [Planctomycetes bacterium]|nr:PAS domain S-box protein [Planctomycetota bacterium]